MTGWNYAELDDDNRIVRIMVVPNIADWTEADGEAFCQQLTETTTRWVKGDAYQRGSRKNRPGIGLLFDEGRDAFITDTPFPSWVFSEDTCQWVPPVDYPDGYDEYNIWVDYAWNEETVAWDELPLLDAPPTPPPPD